MAPYLNKAQKCTVAEDKCSGIFLENANVYTLDGTLRTKETSSRVSTILLADSIILTGGYTQSKDCTKQYGKSKMLQNICGDFQVRISPRESVYTTGKNVFYFYITKYGIYPIGMPEDTHFTFTNSCNLKSSDGTNGYGCSAWVIMNGNMDYLHCDDLSWDGKKSCSDK